MSILQFPNISGAAFLKAQQGIYKPLSNEKGKVVFFDVNQFTETTFLCMIESNLCRSVFDIRPCPVFERPDFRHRYLVTRLFQQDVLYEEYALLLLEARENSSRPGYLQDQTDAILTRGLTVCLVDADAKTSGWVEDVRLLLRRSPVFQVELHPRSIFSTVP